MNTLIWILFILLIASAVMLIAVVLMQNVKTSGLGATFGGNMETESFYGKNKSKTRDGRLQNLTKLLAVVIGVLCIVLTLILNVFTAAGL